VHDALKNVKLPKKSQEPKAPKVSDGKIRLNRYIAQCGICSRREADERILNGEVMVNGQVVTEMGLKIDPANDSVKVNNKVVKPENFVYILMNKPKNYITTNDDPEGRQTVLELLGNQVHERVYPVGRLDRNTTGLLLMTNDGELALKLAHPSSNIRKLYMVKLDQQVSPQHLEALKRGVQLEDGVARADKVDYVESGSGFEVGVEIHSGKNRVVRRMFEAMGYSVQALDRTGYAFLTKKALPRGTWRHLTAKEVGFLKML
jgi:23S rRNA pseudouridine2605 synthase